MIVREYRAKVGARISDKDAQTIGAFIDRRFNGHQFTPDDLVRAARPRKSGIHKYFEWDDTAAAIEWRLEQARVLTRSILVVERTTSSEPVLTRAYHHVSRATDDGETTSGYVAERVVWQTPDYAEQVIDRAQREFLSWKARYSSYTELRDWAIEQLQVEEAIAA